jgi:hypothetical protein
VKMAIVIATEDAGLRARDRLWSKAAPLKLTRGPHTVNGVLHRTTAANPLKIMQFSLNHVGKVLPSAGKPPIPQQEHDYTETEEVSQALPIRGDSV